MLDRLMTDENLTKSIEHIRSGVNEAVNALEVNAKKIIDQSGEVVKKYPVYALMGAMAVGFIAGTLLNETIKKQKH